MIHVKKTILMLGLILTLFTNSVSAEEFIIEADGYHTVSRKETILEAEEAAVNDALRWAVEQIGVRISAYSEVVNKVLKEDTVQRFASSVVKIREKTLTPKVMNDDYRIYAHVVCVVNTDDLDRWEPPDVERQRRLEEDKKRLEAENEKLANKVARKLSYDDFKSIEKEFKQAKENNKLKEFRDKYGPISSEYDSDSRIHKILGDAEVELGYYFEAIVSYEFAITAGTTDTSVLAKCADAHLLTGALEFLSGITDSDRYSKSNFESAAPLYEKYIMLSTLNNDEKHKLAVCYWNLEKYDKFYNILHDMGQESAWYREIDKWLTPDKKPRFNKKIHGWEYVKNGHKTKWVPTRFYEKFTGTIIKNGKMTEDWV